MYLFSASSLKPEAERPDDAGQDQEIQLQHQHPTLTNAYWGEGEQSTLMSDLRKRKN